MFELYPLLCLKDMFVVIEEHRLGLSLFSILIFENLANSVPTLTLCLFENLLQSSVRVICPVISVVALQVSVHISTYIFMHFILGVNESSPWHNLILTGFIMVFIYWFYLGLQYLNYDLPYSVSEPFPVHLRSIHFGQPGLHFFSRF